MRAREIVGFSGLGVSTFSLAGSDSRVVFPLVMSPPARGFRLLADVALFVAEVSVSLPLSCFCARKLT